MKSNSFFKGFIIILLATGLFGCRKEKEDYYVNWESVDLGKGNIDIQYVKKDADFLTLHTSFGCVKISSKVNMGSFRFDFGNEIRPVSNSRVFVSVIDQKNLYVLHIGGDLTYDSFFNIGSQDGEELKLIISRSLIGGDFENTPMALTEIAPNSDSCFLYYIAGLFSGQNPSGYYLVKQPIFAKKIAWLDTVYPLKFGKRSMYKIDKHPLPINPTFHKGFVYCGIKSRFNTFSNVFESLLSPDIQFLRFSSPVSDTLIAMGFNAGINKGPTYLKFSGSSDWDNVLTYDRPGTPEAVGKIGRLFAIGFSGQIALLDFDRKKVSVLKLGNLPKDRIISGIAEYNGDVYVGFRFGGLFKKSKKEVFREFDAIQ